MNIRGRYAVVKGVPEFQGTVTDGRSSPAVHGLMVKRGGRVYTSFAFYLGPVGAVQFDIAFNRSMTAASLTSTSLGGLDEGESLFGGNGRLSPCSS